MLNYRLLEVLESSGLSEHEARVYLAGVSLGPSTILKIARTAEVKRTTVYSVMESLKLKGLMSIGIKGFKSLYVAENPEKLESVIESKKIQLQKLLPEFSALYNLQSGESSIKYYQGLESVKSVYEGLIRDIKPREDYLIVSDQSKWIKLDEDYFKKFTERRAKLPINIRMLQVDTEVAREYKKYEKNYNYTMKFLPPRTNLTTNLVITPQRVVIHQLTTPIMAIVIENKSVIQMHRETFEIMWNSIKE